jgi:hypothetical protein
MSRRPASFTQADVARAMRAARQAGAAFVEVRIGDVTLTVDLTSSTAADDRAVETRREVIL